MSTFDFDAMNLGDSLLTATEARRRAMIPTTLGVTALQDPARRLPDMAKSGSAAPLLPGEELLPGQARLSANGAYALVFQQDANLVIYRVADKSAKWATNKSAAKAGKLKLQSDGNLVVYDSDNKAVWASNTVNKSATALFVGDDGVAGLLGPDGILWSSATVAVTWTGPKKLRKSGVLARDTALMPGDALLAPDGAHALWYREDGDLAMVRLGTDAILWHTGTQGRGTVKFQSDGNLVVYVPDGGGERAIWSSETYNKGGETLEIDSDLSLHVYDKSRASLWSSPGKTDVQAELYTVQGAGTVFGASEASADPPCSLPAWVGSASAAPLIRGEALTANQARISPDGAYALVYQQDGNLVLYRVADRRVMWASGTAGKSAGKATLQGDGNFVVYDAAYKAVWASGTKTTNPLALLIGDNGEARLIGAYGTVWTAGTAQSGPWDAPRRLLPSLTMLGQLFLGDAVLAPNGRHALWLRDDGMLVVVRLSSGGLLWTSGWCGQRVEFRADKNVVLYDGANQIRWSSNTTNRQYCTMLTVTDEGVAVIMDQAIAAWSTPQAVAVQGVAFRARLPEMVVSYARGLVIQARVTPGVGTILELSNDGGDFDVIALSASQKTLELRWHDGTGKLQAFSAPVLTGTGWRQVTVVVARDGVSFYRDGALVQTTAQAVALPSEVSRGRNAIGDGHSTGMRPFSGAIADVRLWNRALGAEASFISAAYQPLGHEPGLSGWWTLEGAQGLRDGSPFGRHGALVGPQKAAQSTYKLVAAQDRHALGLTNGRVEVGECTLDGTGFTWQALVRVNDLARLSTLLKLEAKDAQVQITTQSGKLTYKVTRSGTSYSSATNASLIKVGEWVALAVRQAPDSKTSFFVNGVSVVTSGALQLPAAANYKGVLADNIDGQMAEVRLWTRELSDAEVLDTSARRIHGWAPGLIGCWRMNEMLLPPDGALINADPSGPAATAIGLRPTDRGALSFGPPPNVAPPRVAWLGAKDTLSLPGLPVCGASGLSVQLWVNPDALGDGTLLTMLGANKVNLTLKATSRGELWIASVGAGAVTKTIVDSMLTPRRWAHVTVTLDAQGLTCVYKDGVLVARADASPLIASAFELSALGGAGFTGSLSELRVWARALSAHEIAGNWQRRASAGPGLVGRWALAGDLSGTPGDCVGAPLWREAPSLRAQDAATPTPATVAARASLLADQTGNGGKPTLCVDLTARDDRGQPLPNTQLTVVLSYPAVDGVAPIQLWRGAVTDANKIPLSAGTSPQCTVTTGPQGTVRLVFPAESLVTPVFRVRHAKMGKGEWCLVTPDQVLHQALATLTASELRDGRRATAQRKAGTRGLVSTNAEELAALLGGMLGAVANFSFEEESTAALAFDDGEQAPALPPLESTSTSTHGATFVVAETTPLVRRLGQARTVNIIEAEAPASTELDIVMPEAFGLFEWAAKGISVVANYVKQAASSTMDTVEGLASATKAVVESITIAVNTVIGGCKVFIEKVVTTVEQMAALVVDVFKAINKSLIDVFNYLAELFDWGDILETAEFILTQIEGAITPAKASTLELCQAAELKIRELETSLLTKLGGKAPAAVASEREDGKPSGPPEPMPMLDYLISLLPEELGELVNDVAKALAPMKGAMDNALSRLSGLGDGLAAEWNSPALQASFAEPSKFLDSDPSDWLAVARLIVRVIANTMVAAVGVGADLVNAALEAFRGVLKIHLVVPGLTNFLEQHVLAGKQLTIGRMVCLLGAIPTTLIYKLATGSTSGPVALTVLGPQTFADDEPSVADFAVEIVMRGVGIGVGVFGAILDVIASTNKDALDKLKPWVVVQALLDGVQMLATAIILGIKSKADWQGEEGSTAARFPLVFLDRLGWLLGAIGWGCKMANLHTANTALDRADGVLGIASDAVSLVSGVIHSVDICLDDTATKGPRAVAILDTVSSIGGLAAGILGMALPPDPTYKPIAVGAAHVVAQGCGLASLVVFCATGPT